LSFPALTAATYQKEKLNEAGGGKTFWAAFRHRLALAFSPQFPHFPISPSVFLSVTKLACYVLLFQFTRFFELQALHGRQIYWQIGSTVVSFHFCLFFLVAEGHVCVLSHLSVFFTACFLFMLFLLIENNLVPFYGPPSSAVEERGNKLGCFMPKVNKRCKSLWAPMPRGNHCRPRSIVGSSPFPMIILNN